MKILFFGGTGLVGNNFYQYLLNKKVDMDIISRNKPLFRLKKKDKWFKSDVTKKINVVKEMKNFYDIIIIGTTPSAKDRFTKSINKKNYTRVNVDGLKNILNFLEKIKFNKIIYLSSGVVYGRDLFTKKNENSKLLLNKTDKLYEYGKSKINAENIIKNYCYVNNINFLILRIFSVINFKINQYNIGYVINAFIKSSIEKNSINILDNPNNKISYLDIDSFNRVLFKLLNKKYKNMFINIGSNQVISLINLAKIVAKIFNDKTIIRVPNKIKKKTFYVPNTNKLKKLFKNFKPLSIENICKKIKFNLIKN